jgi:3-phenylpropionate/trans-cinnamate dioxygenase ferredoxin component
VTERVRIGPIGDVTEGSGSRFDHGEHRVALFRFGTDVYAIGDRCSHAEASLSEGEVFDLHVECPRHGSEFDLLTGEPTSLPATRPVPTYDVEIVDGDVYLLLPGAAS